MKSILLIEDDASLGQEICNNLQKKGYSVFWAQRLSEADPFLSQFPDLILLDWDLPDGEGLTWLIRQRSKQMIAPVLMLTARTDLHDKISGLEMGANDYITKPFEYLELFSRIRSHLKENLKQFENSHFLYYRDLKIDSNASCLYKGKDSQEKVELSQLELHLLEFLIPRAGKVFSRDELITKVWSKDPGMKTRAVDNLILSLRKKIGADYIETIRGAGYRLAKDSN